MNKPGEIDGIVKEMPAAGAAVSAPAARSDAASSRCLSEFEVQSIDLFVSIAHLVAIPKSVAEIYGLLFSSPSPLSFDDIVTRLRISKGSASQGLRLLRIIGAAKSTYVAGERRDYFLAEVELRKLVVGFLNEQIRPHLAGGEERLAALAGLLSGEPESRRVVLMNRVRKLESWRATTVTAIPTVIGLLGEAAIS